MDLEKLMCWRPGTYLEWGVWSHVQEETSVSL